MTLRRCSLLFGWLLALAACGSRGGSSLAPPVDGSLGNAPLFVDGRRAFTQSKFVAGHLYVSGAGYLFETAPVMRYPLVNGVPAKPARPGLPVEPVRVVLGRRKRAPLRHRRRQLTERVVQHRRVCAELQQAGAHDRSLSTVQHGIRGYHRPRRVRVCIVLLEFVVACAATRRRRFAVLVLRVRRLRRVRSARTGERALEELARRGPGSCRKTTGFRSTLQGISTCRRLRSGAGASACMLMRRRSRCSCAP